MNPDFSNASKQQSNNYYKYNQQSGYGAMPNQYNSQQGGGYGSNAYSGYPEQYPSAYYNPYPYQTGAGQQQGGYPYNYQAQAQAQPQTLGAQNYDQNANYQYQQMLLQSLSGNQQYIQGTTGVPQTGGSPNQTQPQTQNQTDLNAQYQQAQMGGYTMPGYGYDMSQMNMFQMNPQGQMPVQAYPDDIKKSPDETKK